MFVSIQSRFKKKKKSLTKLVSMLPLYISLKYFVLFRCIKIVSFASFLSSGTEYTFMK